MGYRPITLIKEPWPYSWTKLAKVPNQQSSPVAPAVKASLEVIQTSFKKWYISNALNGNDIDVDWGAEEACEASDENNFSGKSDEDAREASTSEFSNQACGK